MTRDEALLQIIGQIYDAASSPDRWAACLTSIRDELEGSFANLLLHDFRSHDGGIRATTIADPAAIRAYDEYFHRVDPWALKASKRSFGAGTVFLGQALVSHQDMLKTEFYADYGRSLGTTRTVVGILEAPESRVTAALTVNRTDADSEFGPEDARLVSLLLPHIQRAWALHRRLTNIDAQRAAAADVIDRLNDGVVLFDMKLRPVLVNDAARRLFAQRDGLALGPGGLRAASSALTDALRRLMVSAAAVTDGASLDVAEGTLTIPRPSGRPPLRIVVTPLARQNEYAGLEARAAVVVFITDPEHAAIPSEDVLRRLYRLAPTEARVALAIADGQKVEQIAASLHLTRNTVRWYIKQALAKTGSSTQAQLVRLILTHAPIAR
jgi:DNA-binding CsgD family transcriptional regulator/PAS domain-containing protein